jgi:hypothetical protein
MAKMNQLVDQPGARTLHLRISLVELREGHHVHYCLCPVASIKPRNIGQNFLPNNLSIMKSKHMKLNMFHLKLTYTYVHTYISNEKCFKVKAMDKFRLLKMTKC